MYCNCSKKYPKTVEADRTVFKVCAKSLGGCGKEIVNNDTNVLPSLGYNEINGTIGIDLANNLRGDPSWYTTVVKYPTINKPTLKQFLQSKGVLMQFLKNIGEDSDNKATQQVGKKTVQFLVDDSLSIVDAFTWSETSEGGKFWNDLHDEHLGLQ